MASGPKLSSETQGLPAGMMRYFRAKVYFKSRELILTEPVPEVVEFLPADWAEKYFFCPISGEV